MSLRVPAVMKSGRASLAGVLMKTWPAPLTRPPPGTPHLPASAGSAKTARTPLPPFWLRSSPLPTAMAAGGTASGTIVNPLTRNQIAVTINKTVTGAPASGAPGGYAFSLACDTGTYTGTVTSYICTILSAISVARLPMNANASRPPFSTSSYASCNMLRISARS